MGSPETFDTVRSAFEKLTSDAGLVARALELLGSWLEQDQYASQRSAITAHIEAEQWALLLDSFYQFVPFGTGGRRGRVGYGPNRINQITVAQSVQGHCLYLRETYPSAKEAAVVVACDTRIFRDIGNTYSFLGESHGVTGLTSRELARQACEIYAANGFIAYPPTPEARPGSGAAYLATPELSFQIRNLGALGGVNISASHNHPDDNGFKFFDREGGQEIPPTDEYLASFMNDVREIRRMPFDEASKAELIRKLPDGTHEAYVAASVELRTRPGPHRLRVGFTPLCGTGDATAGDVLRAAGFEVALYEPHANFDGTFSAVPSRLPNPEVPGAARPALAFAAERGSRVVLSTDPDADRLGVFARGRTEAWRYFTGNDIAIVLAYYLTLDRELGPGRRGVIIKTLVTTSALDEIARRAGCPIVSNLLVGFKYIAHVLASLEKDGRYLDVKGRPADLILAAEESHGFLLTPRIRDKDAAGAALVLCELAERLEDGGCDLPSYLDNASMESGNYSNTARSIVMRGIRGSRMLAAMMQSLRAEPVSSFGGYRVLESEDQLDAAFGLLRSETERLSRNLLVYRLEGGRVIIRPSGTEPKAKVYVEAAGAKLGATSRAEADAAAGRFAEAALRTCLERIGVRLSESASLLPDFVDIDLKRDFDSAFRVDLAAAAAELARSGRPGRLAWLRTRLSAYAGGADPLDATAPAVRSLCRALASDSAGPRVREALEALDADLALAAAQGGA